MIYFDNAATSFPKIQEAYKAAYSAMTEYGANPGRSGHSLSIRAARAVMSCREELAQHLKISEPMRIAFTYSATDALNTAIMGLLNRGERVIAGPYEHNAVMRPLKELEKEGQIELTVLKTTDSEEIRSAVKPNTTLGVFSHASNVTGEITDLMRVSRVLGEYGIPLLADCAQTAGVLDISPQATGAKLIAMPGHKGLQGLHGTGALYIAEGYELRPLRYGGTGSLSESMYQPTEMPDALESGTQNLVGLAALCEGVKCVGGHIDEIREYEGFLTDNLREMLAELSGIRVLRTGSSEYV
ncbi:MAG: aminotransferase class V-fold PLP-dependent enzyme, partial [Eubacteriales bacterium]|nr:aminotransferase class V-fold PLP-dependent enzyme [Eubacteriales bacterium]